MRRAEPGVEQPDSLRYTLSTQRSNSSAQRGDLRDRRLATTQGVNMEPVTLSVEATASAAAPDCKYGDCGVIHDACPNDWKGSCDRSVGHDGAHHCSSCNAHY